MEKHEEFTEVRCDACVKLIYHKDEMTRKAMHVDYFKVEFGHYDNYSTMGASRSPSGVYKKDICSEKCLTDAILPYYKMRVDSKRHKLENTEYCNISHIAFV